MICALCNTAKPHSEMYSAFYCRECLGDFGQYDENPVQHRSSQGERATRPGALLPDAPGPFRPLDQWGGTEIAMLTNERIRKDAQ